MRKITRRDFVNSTLIGAGATLLTGCTPESAPETFGPAVSSRAFPPAGAPANGWYGYGGIGDYASSHGNTPELVGHAHNIRYGKYDAVAADWIDTGETYDTIIVGAGMAGLGAALEFSMTMPPSKRCLILDNHPVFGGESKQNEFEVDGFRLTGPQGSNGFSIPPVASADEEAYAIGDAHYYRLLDIPREFSYSEPTGGAETTRFGNDNFGFLHWMQDRVDVSHFYGAPGERRHAARVWDNDLADLNVPGHVRKALLEWVTTEKTPHPVDGLAQWLDSMSIKSYLEDELGIDPVVTAYADPIIGAGVGSACDTTSAFVMYAVGLPGFKGYHDYYLDNRHSFPGGNSGFARYFVKRFMPRAITGSDSFEDILNGAICFDELDKDGEQIRMRLSSTVVRVEHEGDSPDSSDFVTVSYVKGDKVYRARARTVVMASGGWVNKHIVKGLPRASFEAYDTFNHAASLVANVALTNWEFMHKLGVSGCLYDGEFGFACNLRNPMVVGDRQQPHDPSKPAVLTFYVPFITPGLTAAQQGNLGRMQLFSTSFADYERQIVRQMNELFAATGFTPERDIAGIVLNRWGHAYIMPEPGFFFGRNGETPASKVVSKPYGRIGFGHSELQGMQHWGPAANEGRRALSELTRYI
ncbi:MAG: NAD(P)-binding protein [Gammaproteobacteria bacterium]|nr:NAD(P)-binding protein [Gammaproteobacteria bacterium]MDE0273509.1 NAD(P)-binding protein [Gammaproteobacteria bacterium]